ncbi:MAG: hypothetical protein LBG97_09990 [Coriobacteriales bacterium]|jgi:predicted nucleotidyltransferase|nr:hypothetical protein [Coriobacteriales bacterium]
MQEAELSIPGIAQTQPWNTLLELTDVLQPDSWILVGGLMVQAHALLERREVRVTKDIDILIDVLANTSNISHVLNSLESLGFSKQEPGLRGSAFHRLIKGEQVVDTLIADHLPSQKRAKAKVDVWPMMEVPGGAQAISRRMLLSIGNTNRIYMPNLLGAMILKAAAYQVDRRERERHLDDIALLASLITDHASALLELHGSDKKRLKAVWALLRDHNHPSWLKLASTDRLKGQDTLRILAE